MTILTWLVAGGLTGWAASKYLGFAEPAAIVFNIAVAIVGAAIGGLFLGSLLGVEPGFTGFGVMVSMIGAALLLTVVHCIRQFRAS
jgi:uncharacterized membrane protein YeaQ/YmgE (transglycosylase-associated protein family)